MMRNEVLVMSKQMEWKSKLGDVENANMGNYMELHHEHLRTGHIGIRNGSI